MGSIRSFRDLVAWQRGIELARLTYLLTAELPKDERYGLTAQMRKAAVSIPANISEGYGRRTRGEYLSFLSVARGSLLEMETYFELLVVLELTPEERVRALVGVADEVGALLWRLEGSLRPAKQQS